MADSTHLAGLISSTLLAISITESINLDIFTNNLAPVVYLNGTLLFVAGLSIVRVHNQWTRGWPVLVTLIGWLVLLGGLTRMIALMSAQQAVQSTTSVLALTGVLFSIGVVLTFKAYGPHASRTTAKGGT